MRVFTANMGFCKVNNPDQIFFFLLFFFSGCRKRPHPSFNLCWLQVTTTPWGYGIFGKKIRFWPWIIISRWNLCYFSRQEASSQLRVIYPVLLQFFGLIWCVFFLFCYFWQGGNELKVFDILASGRLLHNVSNHQKTITSLTFASDASRLLTGKAKKKKEMRNKRRGSSFSSWKKIERPKKENLDTTIILKFARWKQSSGSYSCRATNHIIVRLGLAEFYFGDGSDLFLMNSNFESFPEPEDLVSKKSMSWSPNFNGWNLFLIYFSSIESFNGGFGSCFTSNFLNDVLNAFEFIARFFTCNPLLQFFNTSTTGFIISLLQFANTT